MKMNKKQIKNDSVPLSFRVEISTHKKYIKLPSMKKKEFGYKINLYIKKLLKQIS